MTLEEMEAKWVGWTFVVTGPLGTGSRGYWIDAYDNPARQAPYATGELAESEAEACDNLDAWMTKHIKRPRARKGAKGAKKGGDK